MKFYRKDMMKITGLTSRRIEFLVSQRMFDSIDADGPGSGNPVEFKPRHVVETYLMKQLNIKGIALKAAKDMLSVLRAYPLYRDLFNADALKEMFLKERYKKVFVAFFNESNEVAVYHVGNEKNVVAVDMQTHESCVVVHLTDIFKKLTELM